VLAYYTEPSSRSLAAAAAAAETLGMASIQALDWKAAAVALEQSLTMHARLLEEQPGRPGAGAEAGKAQFLLCVAYRELGKPEKVCRYSLMRVPGSLGDSSLRGVSFKIFLLLQGGVGQRSGRCTPRNQGQQEKRVWSVAESRACQYELVPKSSLLGRPPGGHYVALCTHDAAVSGILCKGFLQRHSTLCKKNYCQSCLEALPYLYMRCTILLPYMLGAKWLLKSHGAPEA
jgi:hypothetical protein